MKALALTKVLSGVLIGGMLLSGGAALADEIVLDSTKNPVGKFISMKKELKDKGKFTKKHWGNHHELLQESLEQFVKEGTITKDKADEIKAYIEKFVQEKQKQRDELKNLSPEERKALLEKRRAELGIKKSDRIGLFDNLVKENILTQEQADTIKTKMKEIAEEKRQQIMADSLKGLVDNGTITQEQANAVIQQFKNPLDTLIDEGTINEDQAKAIKKVLHPRGNGHHKGFNAELKKE